MTTVSCLPKDPGITAWNALLPAASRSSQLEEATSADWLIIGGGFAGLSAARRLSQLRRGERIVLLEAKRVGEGPAGRNSGFMIDMPHDLQSEDYGSGLDKDRQQIRQNRAAIDFAREAVEEFGISQEAFDPCGKTNIAATERGLAANEHLAKHFAALNEPIDLLDAQQCKEITGSDYYISGLFSKGTIMLQPALYVRSLAEGLSSSGVKIYENSPVVKFEKSGTDWRAVTPKGSVTAPKVVLAVNGHANSFGYFKNQLMHVFTYASMTRELTKAELKSLGGHDRWACTSADPMGSTVRKVAGTGGHRLVIRNRATFNSSLEVDEKRIKTYAKDHDRSFKRRWPGLAHVEMAYRWGGRLCLSMNSVPAFGEIEDGVVSAVCQNGLGTAKGTLSGMCAAEYLTKGNSPFVSELLAADPPKKLPPEPIASIGANLTLRWKEFRAGKEL